MLRGARIFDGERFHDGMALAIESGLIRGMVPEGQAPEARQIDGILAPGFLDLQVNGGGGHQIGATTTAADLAAVCSVHRAMGSAGCLPTLITDRPEVTARVIAAGIAAKGAPGFLGLHLEGPHLDPRRAGAHDPALIRPMGADDLATLCDAARALPALMLTVAPEAVTPAQIAKLTGAGVIVSLGHSDCSFESAQAAMAAGARCVTHLFNAMSGFGHRSPGLAGAALAGHGAAGLIADGIHVHPAAMQVTLAARPSGIFLVSDCMACAGTELTGFTLNGRRILRREGRLTLEDGTLAGADLTLPDAVRGLIAMGTPPERALAMATTEPARVLGLTNRGRIAPGLPADLVWLGPDWRPRGYWMGGVFSPASRPGA